MRAMRYCARSAALTALTLFVCHCQHISLPEPPSLPAHAAAPWSTPPEAMPTPPPVTLTASDGTGLVLTKLTSRAVLQGPLAFTELRLEFVNPQSRVLEGTFKITLPQSASVSRLGMLVDERWQEGEVVERQRARIAYEDFLHRKRDPALLEQSAGNEFSARVFPILANATKGILVSYAEELPGAAPYVLRLRGLPKVDAVDVSVSVAESNAALATLRQANWAPDSDMVVDRLARGTEEGLRSGELVLAPIRPLIATHPDPPAATVVLFDTSASRALGFEAQTRAFEGLVAKLAESTGEATWTLACFDQSVEQVYSGPLRGAAAAMERIRARGPLGASDLSRALTWARHRAQEIAAKRVLVVSDGVVTAGKADRASLIAAARALGAAGVERVDALAVGGIRDDGLLRALSVSGLKHAGIVVGADQGAAEVARRLGEATSSNIAVNVQGARWFYPRSIAAAQYGDEFLVYAEVPDATSVSISLGGAPGVAVPLRPVERPLIERAWAQAKISSLLDQEDIETDAAAIQKQVVDLSTKHRVLSPYTALLVLETEQDYARFRIDRNALADILSVQGSRVALLHRKETFPLPIGNRQTVEDSIPTLDRKAEQNAEPFGMFGLLPSAPAANPAATAGPWNDSFGKGALGLSGVGEGGGGRGEGIGLGNVGTVGHGAGTFTRQRLGAGHAVAGPRLREGSTSVSGRLPPEVIQRIVRPAPQQVTAPPDEGAPTPAVSAAADGPYAGRFAEVMRALDARDVPRALQLAWGMRARDAGDVMGLVALGEALEAAGDAGTAARAYGSLVDLFPSRADMRRMAGERLERLSASEARDLAVDTYAKALEQRPDHPSSHRLLAFARLERQDYAAAFDAAVAALAHPYPTDRFPGVERVLREDLGLIGAAWAAAEPKQREAIGERVRAAGAVLETEPSLRFVLTWETDANDVDLHVRDSVGDHAFYSHPSLASGGELYADVRTGYGPECFTIRLPKAKRSKYALQVHYYARGPMGYGMGKVEVIDHDGRGGLSFSERPFVVMNDQAFVELGTY